MKNSFWSIMTLPVTKNSFAPRQRYSTLHQFDSKTCSSRERNGKDLDALANDLGFVLKSDQKEAVLSKRRDVFAVLSKAFGKSRIFQLFVLAKSSSSLNAASLPLLNSKAHNLQQSDVDASFRFVHRHKAGFFGVV